MPNDIRPRSNECKLRKSCGQQEGQYLHRQSSILVKQFICQCFELYIDKYTIVVTSTATSTRVQGAVQLCSFVGDFSLAEQRAITIAYF